MTTSLFYVPALHKNQVKTTVPDSVAFIPCGLTEIGEDFPQALSVVMDAFPLKPADAGAVLNDMLRLGEEYVPGGLLSQLAQQQYIQPHQEKWKSSSEELADLRHFSETGALPGVSTEPKAPRWGEAFAGADEVLPAIRRAVVDCQKTLLLIYALEERSSEMKKLQERYAEAENALQGALGEESVHVGSSLRDEEKAGGAEAAPAVPWRVMVDAALPFLPEHSMLFTSDLAMAIDLREAGMLQPLPENKAAACEGWPETLVSGLLYVNLPAWRLVGRRGPLRERPWLDREVELLVARPSQGWTKAVSASCGANCS